MLVESRDEITRGRAYSAFSDESLQREVAALERRIAVFRGSILRRACASSASLEKRLDEARAELELRGAI